MIIRGILFYFLPIYFGLCYLPNPISNLSERVKISFCLKNKERRMWNDNYIQWPFLHIKRFWDYITQPIIWSNSCTVKYAKLLIHLFNSSKIRQLQINSWRKGGKKYKNLLNEGDDLSIQHFISSFICHIKYWKQQKNTNILKQKHWEEVEMFPAILFQSKVKRHTVHAPTPVRRYVGLPNDKVQISENSNYFQENPLLVDAIHLTKSAQRIYIWRVAQEQASIT